MCIRDRPVICADKNGTACYVEEGVNGYLFRDNDMQSLKERISGLLGEPDKIKTMGRESYRLVLEKYQFEQYYQNIQKLIETIE